MESEKYKWYDVKNLPPRIEKDYLYSIIVLLTDGISLWDDQYDFKAERWLWTKDQSAPTHWMILDFPTSNFSR